VKQGINEEFFSRLYQWRLNTKTKAVSGQYLSGTEFSMEFPVINDHYTGLHHSYAYAQVVDSLESSYGVNEKGIS
jgi:carotenoid cleavage dioxygenase-like enzyme